MYGLLLRMKLVYMIPISVVPILRLTIDLGPHRGRMVTTLFVNSHLTNILPAKNINHYNNSLCSYIFTTAHFAKVMQLWVSIKFYLVGKTITLRKTGSNPLYPSSSKPSYLSPTYSTTWCQKNYLERHQSIETINKKIKENQTGKKMEGNLWCCQALHCQFFRWQMETTLEKGLEASSSPSPSIYLTRSKML